MSRFRARQIATIRDAVAAGREAMRGTGRYEPLVFARAFVAAGGVQLPGQADAGDEAAAVGRRLLAALLAGSSDGGGDRHLQREIDRARNEARWAEAARDEAVVGFFLQLPPGAEDMAIAEALAHENHGLGPGVFRKGEIVVLQPDCDGARFVPVRADEIEC